VFSGVVLVFDPASEVSVERVDVTEVECAVQEGGADGAKEALDLAFGGAIADGGVAEQTADAAADLGDFLGRVDAAVVCVLRSYSRLFGESPNQPPVLPAGSTRGGSGGNE
jgi:hypothetical protein